MVIAGFSWSPDSRRLAFASVKVEIETEGRMVLVRYLGTQMEVFDLARRTRTKIMQGPPGAAPPAELTFFPDGQSLLFVDTLSGVIRKCTGGSREAQWKTSPPRIGLPGFRTPAC